MAHMTSIEKELSKSEKDIGMKRKWIPAKEVIKRLESLKEPSMWKTKGAGGQDQYAGLPPAIREIDSILEMLK